MASRAPILVVAAVLAIGPWPLAAPARADGGVVRLREAAGPFTVTVFTAPTPLRVGPVDVSVMVQDLATERPLLDAAVRVRLEPPDATAPGRTGEAHREHREARAGPRDAHDDAASARASIEIAATTAEATNKLLYAATTDLRWPGDWRLRVTVERAGETVEVGSSLAVAPAAPPLASLWPYLAAPPIAIALFALQQWLKKRAARTLRER